MVNTPIRKVIINTILFTLKPSPKYDLDQI